MPVAIVCLVLLRSFVLLLRVRCLLLILMLIWAININWILALRCRNLILLIVCPVAAAVRKGLRDVDTSRITCVYNIEPPIRCDGGRDDHGKSVLGSMPTVPAVMGMTLANEAINHILGEPASRDG